MGMKEYCRCWGGGGRGVVQERFKRVGRVQIEFVGH